MKRTLIALALGASLCAAAPAQAQQVDLGTLIQPAQLQMLRFSPPFRPSPTSYNLSEHLGKKTILFFYWMPGYQASVSELVELDKFARTLKGDKLQILTVSRAREPHEVEAVKDVVSSKGVNLPVILDDMTLMTRLGVTNVPTYVAVGDDKRVKILDVGGLGQKLQTGERLRDVVANAAKTGLLPTTRGPGQNPIFQLVGEPMPQFSLQDLNGKTVKSADLVGKKPLIVIFWSALCPHCQRELPQLQAYLNKNGAKVNMVSVTRFNNDMHKQKTYEFVKEKSITFPVLLDDAGVNELYSVTGLPTWVMVDMAGKVSYVAVGSKENLANLLESEVAKAAKAKKK